MSLEHELKMTILDELKVDDVQPADLKDDDPLFGEGLGLDSLDAVELVLLLKKHYQIEIKDMEEAREPFASIAALANHIRAQRTALSPAEQSDATGGQPSNPSPGSASLQTDSLP